MESSLNSVSTNQPSHFENFGKSCPLLHVSVNSVHFRISDFFNSSSVKSSLEAVNSVFQFVINIDNSLN